MGIIHVLPEQIANKIAAGEVIERPASIVKELIENALDAGATEIEVSIKNGGKSLIRVSDNGCGMSEEDAKLAFVRHATSKIRTAEDLESIGSFGFRGEALPSIAAVSRTVMVTTADGEGAGTEISMEGGRLDHCRAAAGRKGTMIEVRDLFFNTPARRKFLKTDATEMGHICDTVCQIALARLDVRFTLESGGKKVYEFEPSDGLSGRAGILFGEPAVKMLLAVESETGGIRVRGLIGKPQAARANRLGQTFFVNGRLVKALGLSYAVQDGYHGLLVHGQYPLAVIFLDLDPERVDVNIHPTKQEVRISNEGEIKSFLKRAVAERLLKEADLAPLLRMPPSAPPLPVPGTLLPLSKTAAPAVLDSVLETALRAAEPVSVENSWQTAASAVPVAFRDQLKITKILGQIHNTFVVAETEDGLILIDQHAAHERVMFEALRRNFESDHPERQHLLMEEILEVHPRQRQILEQSLSFLAQAGFELEAFGENEFVVRAYPAIFKDQSPSAVLRTFLEEREDGKMDTGMERKAEEIAALIACKRQSVKAFDPLGAAALQTLVERLSRCENPFNCPHGRPSFIRMSFSDLERQFKRKL
ncbi:MAG: DNA mismatch repair endonuclease MutL [Candidatus Omnitrophica bacterium]|nr:DNA mismatch repair endonuclease MutL [Candidatus Omnitrophota bacterium]